MIAHFYKRTNSHIELVRTYIDKISQEFPDLNEIVFRKEYHDKSKFLNPELTPYIYITWKYYCLENNIEFDFEPEKIRMQEATYHHVKQNRHHPEYFDYTTDVRSINSENRDIPSQVLVNGTTMSNIDIAEMVADWMSVSEERNTDPFEWAKNNINKRWKFTIKQEELIYSILNKIWKK